MTLSPLSHLRFSTHQPPSKEAWERILRDTEEIPTDLLPVALDYIRQHTQHWPDSLRTYNATTHSLLDQPTPNIWPLIHTLRLHSGSTLDLLRSLARWKPLSSLHTLHIPSSPKPLKHTGSSILAVSPFLSNLHTLSLPAQDLRARGMWNIAGSKHLSNLHTLSLPFNDLPTRSLIDLLHRSRRDHLRSLNLYGNPLSPMCIDTLTRPPRHLPKPLPLTSLNLGNTQTHDSYDTLPPLAASPLRHTLQHLHLNDTNVSLDALHALHPAHGPAFQDLQSLSLGQNNIGLHELSALCVVPSIEHTLRSLDLHSNQIDDEATQELARWNAPLERLDLEDNELSSRGAQTLSNAPWLSTLTHLDLSQNDLSGPEIIDLFNALSLRAPNLRSLTLRSTRLSTQSLCALFASDLPKRLQRLDISHNPITHIPLQTLNTTHTHTALQSLSLESCGLLCSHLHILANSSALSSLTHLDLHSNAIQTRGAHALAQSPHITNLASLSLGSFRGAPEHGRNRIQDEGFVALCTSPIAASLVSLNTSANGLTNTSTHTLQNTPLPRYLTRLLIRSNAISPQDIAPLQRRSPRLHIVGASP